MYIRGEKGRKGLKNNNTMSLVKLSLHQELLSKTKRKYIIMQKREEETLYKIVRTSLKQP